MEGSIPLIRGLPQPMQSEVRKAFSDSLRVYWVTLLGFATMGLLSLLAMRQIPLHSERDERWGLEDPSGSVDDEVKAEEVHENVVTETSRTGIELESM
jgi:hypothetical protein